jgi:UDP-N-acetylmuramoylalanine--D-glutamate ligase
MNASRSETLLDHLDVRQVRGTPPDEVTGISYCSSTLRKGEVFCALRGTKDDGHRHLDEAARRGAAFAVVERFVDTDLSQVSVADSREALALLASAWYRFPSRQMMVVGVTGTNGKTTTALLLRSILGAGGEAVGLVSSIGYFTGGSQLRATHTTPEAPELQALLATMRDRGLQYAVVEVSSHALALHRVTGTTFSAAVYTNLSRDHLDYHGSMRAYLAAKARLLRLLSPTGVAVVRADDPWWAELPLQYAPRLLTYSPSGRHADVRCVRRTREASCLRLTVERGALQVALASPLVASFNVCNLTAASAGALALGVAPARIRRGVEQVLAVPGRFQGVTGGQPFKVVIDYAHTPDALARCLTSAREVAAGRVIVVFGCGGERDKGKRPLMGRVASRLADTVIQTADNPRSEDRGAIFREVESGLVPGGVYRRVPDRVMALRRGVASAAAEDILVAAGKGHERYQLLGRGRVPFREEVAVRRALRDVGYRQGPTRRGPKRGTVVVVGLARAGTASALLLAQEGARVFGTDLRPRGELAEADRLEAAGVELCLGGHPSRLLDTAELVVASPGVPPDNALLAKAEGLGIPVVDELDVSSGLWNGPVLAVTGTNGKTTTAMLLGHVLSEADVAATVAGNVGYPLAAALLDGQRGVAVVEVSSFQLERSPSFRPRIAVLLNVAPDHLDRHLSFDEYAAAKARIARGQTRRDFFVYNSGDNVARQIARACRSVTYPFGHGRHQRGAYTHRSSLWLDVAGEPEHILEATEVPLPGAHNLQNVLAASLAAGLLGVDPAVMARAVRCFRTPPHRLEPVAECRGVLFVNDSKATNPSSTEWALRSVRRTVVLIAGGIFKGGDLARLVRLIRVRCRHLVLFGEAAPALVKELGDAVPTSVAANLHEAVTLAHAAARVGDVVLLSPACSSFDMFRDFEDRGEQFKNEVASLTQDT